LNNKKNKKNYIKELVKTYPKITSGRKNIKSYEKRITDNLKLVHNYFKKK